MGWLYLWGLTLFARIRDLLELVCRFLHQEG